MRVSPGGGLLRWASISCAWNQPRTTAYACFSRRNKEKLYADNKLSTEQRVHLREAFLCDVCEAAKSGRQQGGAPGAAPPVRLHRCCGCALQETPRALDVARCSRHYTASILKKKHNTMTVISVTPIQKEVTIHQSHMHHSTCVCLPDGKARRSHATCLAGWLAAPSQLR
jgi:hypothetical protein